MIWKLRMSKELIERLEELLLLNVANKAEIKRLTSILANVHDELHDPYGQFWCENQLGDRELLEALRDRVDKAMGWTDEEGH